MATLSQVLHEDDFILRVVKRLAEFIARALGLAASQRVEEARRTLQDAAGSVLGIELATLALIDARSAVALLGDWQRVVAAGELLHALAEVELRAGEPARAHAHLAQALSLLEELPPRAELAALRTKLEATLAK